MSGGNGEYRPTITEQVAKLSQYWYSLEQVHQLYDLAEREVVTNIGRPICVANCGQCCQHASVIGYGFEAEYACSVLLGNASQIGRTATLAAVLPRIRDWLTAKGKWTYGRALNAQKMKDLLPELKQALEEPCCFLGDDKRCMIHYARPVVCRSYGVVHMPNRWCPRPLGIGESEDSRAFWDPDHPKIPVRPVWNLTLASIKEPQFNRHGFLATMIYQRFRAKDLAGLLDDGKIPLVKVYQGWGKSPAILWQEDLETAWKDESADVSIAEQVPLGETDGQLHMRLDYRKNSSGKWPTR